MPQLSDFLHHYQHNISKLQSKKTSSLLCFLSSSLPTLKIQPACLVGTHTPCIPVFSLSFPLCKVSGFIELTQTRRSPETISCLFVCVDMDGLGQNQPSLVRIQMEPQHVFSSPSQPLMCRMWDFEIGIVLIESES